MSPRPDIKAKEGDGVKRLHLHVVVESLPDAIKFYSGLFDTPPCCGGESYANWRVDQPPVNLAASVTNRSTGLAHFGLEVESPAELGAIDRVLHSTLYTSGTVPWEVSVKKRPIRKE
jgi:hypothetical protein